MVVPDEIKGVVVIRVPKQKSEAVQPNKPGEDWYTGLQSSEIFMPLVSSGYFSDAKAYAQWQVAKELRKPFLILLEHSVKIPKEELQGIDTVLIEKWEGDGKRDTVKEASLRLLQRFGVVK